MADDSVWKIVIQSTGIAGVGAFFAWSLYKAWLKKDIFSRVTKKQTFVLMLMFLFLIFGFSALSLYVYVKKTSPDEGALEAQLIDAAEAEPIGAAEAEPVDAVEINSIDAGDGSINVIAEDESSVVVD